MSDKRDFSHYKLAALFGIAGFVLGWLTRPLVEARARRWNGTSWWRT